MSATSGPVDICNQALVILGANTIASFQENSLEASASNLLWPTQRRATLRMHPWNFAIRRSDWDSSTKDGGLAQVADPGGGSQFNKEYKYRYNLPSDYLKLLKVVGDMEYRLEGRAIYTDNNRCHIKYIADIEDTADWDVTFVDLMINRMAWRLAYTLPRTRTMIDTMYGLYQQSLMEAKAMDSQEDIEDSVDQYLPDLLAARYSGGSRGRR